MEPVEPEDTCRPVEIDGETIRVHGNGEMTDEDRGHLATIVRAAKARMAHDQAMEVIHDIAVGDTTPSEPRGSTALHRLDTHRRGHCTGSQPAG